MKLGSHKITFGNILLLWGIIYVGLSLFSGELLFQMPNNWFVTWMAGVFQKMDTSGFLNVWSGQSPGFNYLYFIIWKPAMALSGTQPYFALIFSMLWFVISIGSLFLSAYLFYKIATDLLGEEKGVLLGTVFILVFMTMQQWYTVIDAVAIAGMLAAVFLLFRGHPKIGGLVLGITATIKPFGLLLLPVVLKSQFLSIKQKIAMTTISVLSFGTLLIPLALGNFKIFMSSLNWQSGRPPWESIYSFFMWVLNKPYPNSPLFQDASGVSLQDWGVTGITPTISIMTTPVPSMNTWWNMIFVLAMIIVVSVFLLFKRIETKEQLLLGTLFMLGAYFVLFYGWSLQFYFWLVPFMLIGYSTMITIVLRFLTLLEYPFFYALYLSRVAPDLVTSVPGLTVSMTVALGPVGVAGYWGTIIVRTLLIFALSFLVWVKLPSKLWNPFTDLQKRILSRRTGADFFDK
jgi:hypothetical protein